jgi:hypothetical protein
MCFEITGLGSTVCCKGRLFGVGFGGGGGGGGGGGSWEFFLVIRTFQVVIKESEITRQVLE